MIYISYKQWVDGGKYTDGYLGEFSERFDNTEQLNNFIDDWINNGNPIIITGMWRI